MELQKMKKFASMLDRVVQVAIKVFFAFCIVCAVFVVLVPIFGEKVVQAGSFTLDLDFVKIHLKEEYQQITGMMKAYIVTLVIGAGAVCFTIYYGLKIIARLLAPIKEGGAFDETAPLNVGKLAWLFFFGGTVVQLLGVASRVILMLALPMEEILVSAAVTELEFVFRLDFDFLLAFALVRLLAFALSYSQQLRREKGSA